MYYHSAPQSQLVCLSPNSTMPTSLWRPQVRDKPVTSPLICALYTSLISSFLQRKRACCRLVLRILQTISTCRDGLKVETPKLTRDFPVTWSMSAISLWQVVSRRNEILTLICCAWIMLHCCQTLLAENLRPCFAYRGLLFCVRCRVSAKLWFRWW